MEQEIINIVLMCTLLIVIGSIIYFIVNDDEV